MALAPTLSALWRRGLLFSNTLRCVFLFVLCLLRGTVDICKEANGCSSHPGRRAAFFCLDVNIWNVTPDHGSAWVSSDTNKTVNPFRFFSLLARMRARLCVRVQIGETCLCLVASLFTLSATHKEPLPPSWSGAAAHSRPRWLLIGAPWGVTPNSSPFH